MLKLDHHEESDPLHARKILRAASRIAHRLALKIQVLHIGLFVDMGDPPAGRRIALHACKDGLVGHVGIWICVDRPRRVLVPLFELPRESFMSLFSEQYPGPPPRV